MNGAKIGVTTNGGAGGSTQVGHEACWYISSFHHRCKLTLCSKELLYKISFGLSESSWCLQKSDHNHNLVPIDTPKFKYKVTTQYPVSLQWPGYSGWRVLRMVILPSQKFQYQACSEENCKHRVQLKFPDPSVWALTIICLNGIQ